MPPDSPRDLRDPIKKWLEEIEAWDPNGPRIKVLIDPRLQDSWHTQMHLTKNCGICDE